MLINTPPSYAEENTQKNESPAPPSIGWSRAILFSLLPLLFLLLTTELVLRLSGYRFEAVALQVEHAGGPAARMFLSHLESEHFVADSLTFWAPAAGRAPFNTEGYRGDVLQESKPPGELRLLVLGDSNTLGHVNAWPNEIPERLPGLEKQRVRVINAGVYGFTSFQGKHHLERFLRYQPDVVLISFGGNDATPHSVGDKDYTAYQPHSFYAFFKHRSALVDLLEEASLRLAARDETVEKKLVPRVGLDDYAANLEEMIDRVKAAGALPILMTRPMAGDFHQASDSPIKAYYDVTLEVAARMETQVMDVDAMANHSWVLFADHSHFNVKGHRIVGRYVGGELARMLTGQEPLRPRFLPQDREERALHVIGRVATVWRPLGQNVRALREHPLVEGLHRVYDEGFDESALDGSALDESAGGWRVELLPRDVGEPSVEGGALCMPEGTKSATLVHSSLPMAANRSHFIWIEGRFQSEVGMTMSWPKDPTAPVDDSQSVAKFYRPMPEEPPFRFFHVLPEGANVVRLDLEVRHAVDRVCFGRIYAAAIKVPGAPPSQKR